MKKERRLFFFISPKGREYNVWAYDFIDAICSAALEAGERPQHMTPKPWRPEPQTVSTYHNGKLIKQVYRI